MHFVLTLFRVVGTVVSTLFYTQKVDRVSTEVVLSVETYGVFRVGRRPVRSGSEEVRVL